MTLSLLSNLIKAMRPKQWTKNVFVFIAVVADRKLLTAGPFFESPLGRSFLGFVMLCILSGAVYLLNDIIDVEQDRAHPTKRNRPIASGAAPMPLAWVAAIALPLALLPFAFALQREFGVIVLAYWLNNIAYTFKLKHVVLFDVLSIALGFVLRVSAGVILVNVERFSPWLYVFTTFLSLFLGLSKRRGEIALLQGKAGDHRAILDEYTLPFLDYLMNVIIAAALVTYSFYTFSAENLPDNHTMMLTIPFVLYGFFHYLYLVHVRGEIRPPDEVLLKDRRLQITLALYVIAVALVMYQTQLSDLLARVAGS
ncbi:MAG TPA: decaprenyl-phosphate phosphoribosyltransferase [Anaerolineae bacterium]|nr:decaprenyl-phosphate phosphoribosyltransferase [Anaerolineae bacterium]